MDLELIRAFCAKDLNGILKPRDKWYSTPEARFMELETQILFKHMTGEQNLEPRQYAAVMCLKALELLKVPFETYEEYPEITEAELLESGRKGLLDALAAYILHLSESESRPLQPLAVELARLTTTQAAPVVAVGDGPAKRIAKKLSIETVALDYMRKAYKAGQFESAAKFHKHLIKTAGVTNSPFEMGTGLNARRLFCPAAGSFYDEGTLSKIWAKIRAG